MPPENTSVPAPDSIYINGALAFVTGDPVPAEHAKRLGLTGKKSDRPNGPISATADETGIVSVSDGAAPGPTPEGSGS